MAFVKVGIVGNMQNKKKVKLNNPGEYGVMMGYTHDRADGTYQLYNPETKKIFFSRDFDWTSKFYGDLTGNVKDNSDVFEEIADLVDLEKLNKEPQQGTVQNE